MVAVAQEIKMHVGKTELAGFLSIPKGARGMVLFAHGSGSSRHSPRNQYVAKYLQGENFATLLFDLLTKEEEREDARFNIPFLAQRLLDVTSYVSVEPQTKALSLGYFGASTGAAAALMAAAKSGRLIKAVVSRGGRPDLAGSELMLVKCPTLLIVGSRDVEVMELNEQALKLLNGPKKLAVVEGATHLFEETGALEQVCHFATEWFEQHL